MMPFMPIVRTPDVHTAIEWAVQAEQGYHHTAIMHSKNVEYMTKMARLCRCTIFVKNGPSSAGLGAGGEGYTSFSIATPTGEGCTSARTFTRQRRCALIDFFRIV
jgi:propionaldehyde dehydrogenase